MISASSGCNIYLCFHLVKVLLRRPHCHRIPHSCSLQMRIFNDNAYDVQLLQYSKLGKKSERIEVEQIVEWTGLYGDNFIQY